MAKKAGADGDTATPRNESIVVISNFKQNRVRDIIAIITYVSVTII